MARIRVFDLVLTAAALAALMFLLPTDKDNAVKLDTKISHSRQNPMQGVSPTNQRTIAQPFFYTT
jgi:hypothetical protein